jgi:hypothetical protein
MNEDIELLEVEETPEKEIKPVREVKQEPIREVKRGPERKVKILKKEFNFEDVVIAIIGLIVLAVIFLLPRIMYAFKVMS